MKNYLLVLLLIFFGCSSKTEYQINDWFADESDNTRFIFMFVEVNKLDAKELIETAITLKRQYLLDSIDLDGSGVAMIHFYKKSDTTSVPDEFVPKLSNKYDNSRIAEEINFIPKGVMYLGYAGNMIDKKDTIFVSQLFVPKSGTKAKDIFAKNSRNPKDTLK